jgi:antirestriction protein ArdC
MTKANGAYHKRDLYSEVTTRILAELETAAAPWIKPCAATPGLNHPHNAATSRPYSGCNVILLWMASQKHGYTKPRFLTFKRALERECEERRAWDEGLLREAIASAGSI